jgi:flagellar biosynthetic protein FliR
MLNEAVFLNWVEQFLLIFLRVAAIFTVSPVFGRKNVPSILKIMFSVLLAYILIGVFPPPEGERVFNLFSYALECIKELIIGLTIGYITTMFFSIAFTAGQIIDIQTGFSMVQVFDPQFNSQMPIMGNLLNMMMMMSFFMVNGHHTLIRILAETFVYLPVGDITFNSAIALILVDIFVLTMTMALQIAMPVVVASFLMEVALGLILRTVPQMNMFVVGIPLKIIIGIGVMILVVPIFMGLTGQIFEDMFNSVQRVFAGMVTA